MRRLPVLLAGLFISMSCTAANAAAPATPSDEEALRHARALLARVPLVDGHNDLPWVIREHAKHHGDLDGYDLRQHTDGETDLARLKEGGLAGQFWSVYVDGAMKSGWAHVQLEQIELARRMIDRYPDAFLLATKSSDIATAKKAGKVASFLGMEGGHVIENSMGALRAYYDLGVRYMTLTHNVTLDWADAALDSHTHGGLTPFGKEVVREMNRLGMLVDLSHVSTDVMHQALDVSEAPVIFSHTGARALAPTERNVPDDVLERMPANGGVVMVYYVPDFLNKDALAWRTELRKRTPKGSSPEQAKAIKEAYIKQAGPMPKATVVDVADHIDHIAMVAGKDHVGIGADYCGVETPIGLKDVSTYPVLFAELIKRGWTDADLTKLAGANLVRAFAKAEEVATRLQKSRQPSLAKVENQAAQ
jgi:membrane dipeptidase